MELWARIKSSDGSLEAHLPVVEKNVENYKHLMDTKVMELKRAVRENSSQASSEESFTFHNLMRIRTKLLKMF